MAYALLLFYYSGLLRGILLFVRGFDELAFSQLRRTPADVDLTAVSREFFFLCCQVVFPQVGLPSAFLLVLNTEARFR